MKLATALWVFLLILTALTTQAAVVAAGFLVPFVLVTTYIKGQVVIDHFMGLRHATSRLRWIVPAWLLVVIGGIAYTFTLS